MRIGTHETHPAADLMPLLDGADYKQLCANIAERGLLNPIVLYGGKVLDGRNRLRACLDVGVEPRFEDWPGGGNPFEYVWSQNVERRHLDAGRRAALRVEFDEAIAALRARIQEAANRVRAQALVGNSNASKKQSRTTLTATVPEEAAPEPPEQRRTRAVIARAAGVSSGTVQKALTVKARAPELHQKVCAGDVSLNAAYRQVQRAEAIARIEAEPEPWPQGPFRVIVADPPWPYDARVDDGSHRSALPYPSMSIEELCAMPVRELAERDAILWLWTTNAFMRQAFRVVDAWGFGEKTILTWAKNRMGTGDWLRGKTEHCILAVRGRPLVRLTNQTTILTAHVREHSRKPDEFYDLVDALCPGSKVELFARESRPGWHVWGAEADKFDRAGGDVAAHR